MNNQPKKPLVIYLPWKDFRLSDNPALTQALAFAKAKQIPFLPVYTLDDGWVKPDIYNIGYPRRWMLSRSLSEFSKLFTRFEILVCEPEVLVQALLQHFEVYVFLNDDVEPYLRRRHRRLARLLQTQGQQQYFFLCSNDASIDLGCRTHTGEIYSVFTPFKKAVLEQFLNAPVQPLADPQSVLYFLEPLPVNFEKVPVDQVFRRIDQRWVVKIGSYSLDLDNCFVRPDLSQWEFTETAVLSRFTQFLEQQIFSYHLSRDDLSIEGTSRMSVALAWGLVSARTLKQRILSSFDPEQPGVATFLSELLWREFYRYILYHFPEVLNLEFQAKRRTLPWLNGPVAWQRFELWARGETGYPLVDAAMRQLISTAWMHNRCRMVVASILTKNLGIDWRWGQEFFRATLLDLDEASNNGGWQWSASVGADPKPIRIFNPYLQAQKYDPNQAYIKKWLPVDYFVQPLIDHDLARKEARQRYGLS